MNQGIDWGKLKRLLLVVAAIGLMAMSVVGFMGGLNFGGPYATIITVALWVSFTIIQFVGNDLENHDDWIFTLLWIFSYMVGIGASSWALYGWINIGNEYLHWIVAIGLGGSAEVAPERLIVMFLRSGAFRNVKIKPTPLVSAGMPNKPVQTPQGRPEGNRDQQPYRPMNKPQMGPATQFKSPNNKPTYQEPKKPSFVVRDEEDDNDPGFHNRNRYEDRV
jgi:hypothetical protein